MRGASKVREMGDDRAAPGRGPLLRRGCPNSFIDSGTIWFKQPSVRTVKKLEDSKIATV